MPAVDLERERVLPLGPADVQQRPRRRAVVGHRRGSSAALSSTERLPELRPQQCRVERQRTGEPVREVEQVHALVDELAAARTGPGRRATRARSRAGRRDRSAHARASGRRGRPEWTSAAARASAGWKRWLKPTFTSLPVVRPQRASAARSAPSRARPASRRARARRLEDRSASGASRSCDVATIDDVGLERRAARRGRARASAEVARRARRRVGDDIGAADQLVCRPERLCALAADQAAARRSRRAADPRHAYSLAYAPPNSKSKTSSCVARGRHRLPRVGRALRVDEQEAAAARADELPADRAAPTGERVEPVDVLGAHPRRAPPLVLPVLVHQLGVPLEIAGEQQLVDSGSPSPSSRAGSSSISSSSLPRALVLVAEHRRRRRAPRR